MQRMRDDDGADGVVLRGAVTLRCGYTHARRARWCLHELRRLTAPSLAAMWCTRFSLVNHFIFQPPKSTYTFVHRVADDNVRLHLHNGATVVESEASWSQDTTSEDGAAGQPEMIFLPWADEEGPDKLPRYTLDEHGARIEQGESRRKSWLAALRTTLCRTVHCALPCGIVRPRGSLGSSHVAIFFHSNGIDAGYLTLRGVQNIADALEVLVIVPEYPGYGLFCGRCTEVDVIEAMTRLVRFLLLVNPLLAPSQLLLIGQSIGTGVAMYMAHTICDAFHRVQQHGGSMARAMLCDDANMPLAAPHDTSPTSMSERLREPSALATLPAPRASAGDVAAPATPSSSPTLSVSSLNSPTRSSSAKARTEDSNATQGCPHCALGGIVLISAYASIRCIEDTRRGLRAHHAAPVPLLLSRQLRAPVNAMFVAPKAWAEDEQERHDRATEPVTAAAPASLTHDDAIDDSASEQSAAVRARAALASPPLFHWAYGFTTERFATIDVARALQRRFAFFHQTPLLLVHGLEDQLIPALHSIAIASAIRHSYRGTQARVCLVLLSECGHDGVQAEPFIEHFYHHYVLQPQLDEARRRLVGGATERSASVQAPCTAHEPTCHSMESGQGVVAYSVVQTSPFAPEVGVGASADDDNSADHSVLASEQDELPRAARMHSYTSHDFFDASQELPALLPASPRTTMLHLSMLGFVSRTTDVGSITRAAMRRCGVSVAHAADLYAHHRRRLVLLSAVLPTFYALLGVYVLAVGIAHALLVASHEAHYTSDADAIADLGKAIDTTGRRAGRSNKVVVWAALECTNLLLCMLLRLLHPLNGFHRKRQRDRYGGSWLVLYLSLHLLGALLSISCGVLMGFVFALAPPAHGGVRWSAWSTLVYRQRVWVSRVPRWTMVALACMHLVFLSVKVVTNR